MEVIVQIKNVYGNERIYPMNDKAKLFSALVNKVTLSRADIERIKALGFIVKVTAIEL